MKRIGPIFFLFLLPVSFGYAHKQYAVGERSMISAPTPEAVEAGLAILEQGGNAVDAAVATALALTVTDPSMCSLAGRSQILIHLVDGIHIGIDGATQTPLRVDKPAGLGHGYKTAPIPGTPAVLMEMLERFGSLSWKEVLQPAIRLAEEGFVIKKDYHDTFRRYAETLLLYPGSRKHFFKPDGSPYSQGDVFCQPALARTLTIIADEGADALYHGRLARSVVRDMERNGGFVGHDDLARYRPRAGEVVEGGYRGYRLVARGGNCDGASVIEMLRILERFDLPGYEIDDPEYIHLMAQVLYLGFADEHVPDWQQVSGELAARRVREIDLERALPIPVRPRRVHEGETNHLSVVDAEGNAVSITQSIGPYFGSKVAHPELGFFYAYSYDMNDDPVPYQREKTSQSPTLVLKEGKPYLVLGSAGSSRIPGSIVRTIVNVIDHGMTLEEALAAPRCFLFEKELRLESDSLSQAVIDRLTEYGYVLTPYDDVNGYFGRVHAVLVDGGSGRVFGGADPRDYGAAGGF